MPFCKNCGNNVSDGARFCSSCGTQTGFPVATTPVIRRPLSRPREGRMLAGVCRGFSLTYGWDIALVRIIAVILAVICCPVGEVAYIIAWIAMPEEPLALPSGSSIPPVGN